MEGTIPEYDKARVKRDGKWINPPARELVPGDAIRLRLGDIVPADARLLAGDPIEVDQSALTGESLPATRKPGEGDKANAELVNTFLTKQKDLTAFSLGSAAVNLVAELPRPERIHFLNELLAKHKDAADQPTKFPYVETLFLRRLDDLATQLKKENQPWPLQIVRRAMQVMRAHARIPRNATSVP